MSWPAAFPDLSADPGRRSVCHLLPRFIAMDGRLLARRIKRRLGLTDLAKALPEDLRFPDSPVCQQALELARAASQPFLCEHAARSYAFGALLGRREGTRFDAELLFLACILHDLGLTAAYAGSQSFEWAGADAAHRFCLSHGCAPQRAWVVREAIALHASVGFAHTAGPEAALLHYGAGVDVMGIRLDEVPPEHLRRILNEHPRLEFGRLFAELLEREAALKPASHIAGHIALGFAKRVRANEAKLLRRTAEESAFSLADF
jgi:hypothetical protein